MLILASLLLIPAGLVLFVGWALWHWLKPTKED